LQTADVPTLPWTGSGLRSRFSEADFAKGKMVTVPNDLYQLATVSSIEEGMKAVHRIGFPVMIKASEGGGGKGIRKCEHVDDFAINFRQVQVRSILQ
jgi:acetyl-CoA carboxylase/biotin carboxylase 1